MSLKVAHQNRRNDDGQSLYTKLVDLTRYQDANLLRSSLLSSIQILSNNVDIRLYDYTPNANTFWAYNDSTGSCSALQQELDTQQLNRAMSHEGSDVLFIPTCGYILFIYQKHKLIAGMFVANKDLDSDIIAKIQALNAIYANQLFWLHRCNHDQLTNLLNRHAFDENMNQLVLQYRKPQTSCSEGIQSNYLAMIDIDHFKRINDQFGHLYGDEVLVLIAQIMRESFRDSDLLYRFGGEEFIAIALNLSEPTAINIFNRFCEKIAATDFPQLQHVSVSIGLTKLDVSNPISQVIGDADRALYYAKDNGRNQVQLYEQLIARNLLEGPINTTGDIDLF